MTPEDVRRELEVVVGEPFVGIGARQVRNHPGTVRPRQVSAQFSHVPPFRYGAAICSSSGLRQLSQLLHRSHSAVSPRYSSRRTHLQAADLPNPITASSFPRSVVCLAWYAAATASIF